jgi:hypothetical protein
MSPSRSALRRVDLARFCQPVDYDPLCKKRKKRFLLCWMGIH